MNEILRDRELRDWVDDIERANEQLDFLEIDLDEHLEDRDRLAIWRAQQALLMVAEYLEELREQYQRGAS